MTTRAKRHSELVRRVRLEEFKECTFEPKITKRAELLREILEESGEEEERERRSGDSGSIGGGSGGGNGGGGET